MSFDRSEESRRKLGHSSIDNPLMTDVPQKMPDYLVDILRDLGLVGKNEIGRGEKLAGGISSNIWRIDCTIGSVCLKQALPKLRVAADWEVPTERNAFEAAWIRTVAAIEPAAAPTVLAEDRSAGLFVMPYLQPTDYPAWKAVLHAGTADRAVAVEVARRLVHIHTETAGKAEIAAAFATDHIFFPIRIEPYLLATAKAHPDCSNALKALASTTLATKRVLVHGDVSPKNILIGPHGPVFIDAECAWYGDPAFDLAFCLNHLLLKCLWTPAARGEFLACYRALAHTYLEGVVWEDHKEIERRTAHLLPGLFLARIDGKSPVEYITSDEDKDRVRSVARALLLRPVAHLDTIAAAWAEELDR